MSNDNLNNKVYAVYYAVELSLNVNGPVTDEEIGLKDGVFRWITGTPGFNDENDGAITEDNMPNEHKWYEGILTKDGMVNPSRKIDIRQSGDYATLNGFSFSVRNDCFFWEKIEQRKIYITNSTVKVYAVLNNKFYSIWQGVVKSTAYTETEYIFKCETDFKVIHKMFPPEIVTRTLLPDVIVNENAIGKVIPVCLGDVPYAEGLNVSGPVKILEFDKTNGGKSSVFAATGYTSNNKTLNLRTDGLVIVAGDLVGKYLHIIKGNGDDYIRIIGNSATDSASRTSVTLAQGLDGWNNNHYVSNSNVANYEKIWFFQIVEAPVRYIVSQKAIEHIDPTEIYNYKDGYRSVEFAVRDHKPEGDPEGIHAGKYPSFYTITEKAADSKTDAEERELFGLPEDSSDINTGIVTGGGLIDPNSQGGVEFNGNTAEVRLKFPDEAFNFDQIHLAVDMDCCVLPSPVERNFTEWGFSIEASIEDPYDGFLGTFSKPFIINRQKAASYKRINLIDNQYYIDHYYKTHETSNTNTYDWYMATHLPENDRDNFWHRNEIDGISFDPRSSTVLNKELIDEIFNDDSDYEQKIRLKIIVESSGENKNISDIFFYIKEICFSRERDRRRKWIQTPRVDEYLNDGSSTQQSDYCDYRRVRPENGYRDSNFRKFEIMFDVFIPDEEELKNAETINLCIDFDIACFTDSNAEWIFRSEANRIKKNDDGLDELDNVDLFDGKMKIDPVLCQNYAYNFLPQSYYNVDEDEDEDSSRVSLWPAVSATEHPNFMISYDIKDLSLLNPKVIELMKVDALTKTVRVKITIPSTSYSFHNRNFHTRIRLKQIGLIGITKQKFEEDGVYAKDCIGEYLDAIEPRENNSSIYGVFRNILEGYDGINNLDFTNLKNARNSSAWRAGRQIQEQKNSFDYLKELCKQSFVGIVPSRKGNLILKAWLNQAAGVDTPLFNQDTIIRNSIRSFTRSEPQDLFNDFKINYMYNPGADKFDKCLFVTNAWKENFPDIENESTWTIYFGGIYFPDRNHTYSNAKRLWTYCREGYKFAGKPQRAPESLSNLYWCVDDSHAREYLGYLIRWTTRPKIQVEFSIPLNGYISTSNGLANRRNLELELLDIVFFQDPIYTRNKTLTGYITKIESDVKKGEIKMSVIFDPDDYSDLIIERGTPLNDGSLIIESGDRDTIIIEGGI